MQRKKKVRRGRKILMLTSQLKRTNYGMSLVHSLSNCVCPEAESEEKVRGEGAGKRLERVNCH